MKRIRQGACVALGLNQEGEPLEAVESEGKLRFRVNGDFIHVRSLDTFDIERLQAAPILEDMSKPKTPGQVLHESLLSVEVLTETVWSGCARAYKDRMEKAAARLGIKPEGE